LKFFKVWIHQQQCCCTCRLKVLWVLVHCRWSDSRHPVAVVMVDLWTDKTAVCVLRIITRASHCTKWTGLQGESCPSGYHEGGGGQLLVPASGKEPMVLMEWETGCAQNQFDTLDNQ
jgi:hypothetical protein